MKRGLTTLLLVVAAGGWGMGAAMAGMPSPPPLLEMAETWPPDPARLAPRIHPNSVVVTPPPASSVPLSPAPPSPAPPSPPPPRPKVLDDVTDMRLQVTSFFAAGFLLSAAGVWGIWNLLRIDLAFLPRLTFRGALGLTTLWGLLFVVVLTMISGARELMTPGAWVRNGLTYKLADPGPPADKPPTPAAASGPAGAPAPAPVATATPEVPYDRRVSLAERHKALETLRDALWKYGERRGGDRLNAVLSGRLPRRPLPEHQYLGDWDFASAAWQLPGSGGTR